MPTFLIPNVTLDIFSDIPLGSDKIVSENKKN